MPYDRHMKKLSLFDTHCDTAYKLYRYNVGLRHNSECHVSLEKAAHYERYAQYYAIWCDKRLDDEACWTQFLQIAGYFRGELLANAHLVALVTTADELDTALRLGKRVAILAVEDARLLSGKLERLDVLRRYGVRYLTLLWGGDTCIGGSHDTRNGLTVFGKSVVRGCFDRDMIPDISHASEQSIDDILTVAYEYGKPIIASHSDSYSVYPHTRNLKDHHFQAVRELGGIVGISLCTAHLTDTRARSADVEDIFRHVEQYLSLGGEDIVGFGADWDGTALPENISHVGHLTKVAEHMARHNYSEELIEKLFWKNFYRFSINNL